MQPTGQGTQPPWNVHTAHSRASQQHMMVTGYRLQRQSAMPGDITERESGQRLLQARSSGRVSAKCSAESRRAFKGCTTCDCCNSTDNISQLLWKQPVMLVVILYETTQTADSLAAASLQYSNWPSCTCHINSHTMQLYKRSQVLLDGCHGR